MNDWYEAEFAKAIEKTKEWGLEAPRFEPVDQRFDLITVRDNLHYFFTQERWRFPYDFAGDCIDRHIEASRWLGYSIGLPVFLTIGEVFVNGEARYGPTYESLREELENPATKARTFHAHVWLTLPNLGVLDLVLPAAICGDHVKELGEPKPGYEEFVLHAGPESRPPRRASTVRVPVGSKDGSFVYRDVYGKRRKLVYKPMLVGLDFLAKSDEGLGASLADNVR